MVGNRSSGTMKVKAILGNPIAEGARSLRYPGPWYPSKEANAFVGLTVFRPEKSLLAGRVES